MPICRRWSLASGPRTPHESSYRHVSHFAPADLQCIHPSRPASTGDLRSDPDVRVGKFLPCGSSSTPADEFQTVPEVSPAAHRTTERFGCPDPRAQADDRANPDAQSTSGNILFDLAEALLSAVLMLWPARTLVEPEVQWSAPC